VFCDNTNRLPFTAREDDGTGLYYYRARYYHPTLGRFVSEDALRGANLYAYVEDDPISEKDPSGFTNQPGDLGWSGYSFKPPPGFFFPGYVGYYKKADFDKMVEREAADVCARLKGLQLGDWDAIDILIHQWPTQAGFDTLEFGYSDATMSYWYNVEGKFYQGRQVNYLGQGMFDRYHSSIPYWKPYLWKAVYGESPDSQTMDFYTQGLQCECK
jgi:RHS repeat-associated protein